MDLSKMGGDSQNTMPIAINAGMQARQIAAMTPAAEGAAKFSMDAFKSLATNEGRSALLNATKANLPLAEAVQQQSFMFRWIQKIPFVGQWITGATGAEGVMNNLIGSLPKGIDKNALTKALYSATTPKEIAAAVKASGLTDDAAKGLIAAAEQRLVGGAAQAATQVAANAGLSEIIKDAAGLTLKKAANGVMPSPAAIEAALKAANPAQELGKLGFFAKDAKGLVARMTSSTVTTVENGAAKVVQTTTTEVAKQSTGFFGKVGGFLQKHLGGAKGNFIIAGVFSLASNAIQLAQGKMTLTQFAALTVMDTAAYGAIGWGSAAAGAAIGTALFPGVGTIAGLVIGFGLGFLGGSVYEKFVRTPVKNMLGPDLSGGAAPNDPYNPNGNQPQTDPYAQPPANNQGYPQQPMGPGALPPIGPITYEQAAAEIARLEGRR